jgi:hypothetical protein
MLKLLIKVLIFCWLLVSGLSAWISLNIVSYLFLLSQNATDFAPVTWLMSVTVGLTMIVVSLRSLNVDVVVELENNMTKIKNEILKRA